MYKFHLQNIFKSINNNYITDIENVLSKEFLKCCIVTVDWLSLLFPNITFNAIANSPESLSRLFLFGKLIWILKRGSFFGKRLEESLAYLISSFILFFIFSLTCDDKNISTSSAQVNSPPSSFRLQSKSNRLHS